MRIVDKLPSMAYKLLIAQQFGGCREHERPLHS